LSEGTFPYLDHFTDRTQDISELLATVLETLYAGSLRLDEERQMLADAIAVTRNEANSQSAQLRILIEVEKIMDNVSLSLAEQPSVLASRLAGQGLGVTETEVSRALLTFGFKKQSLRKGGEDPKWYYVIDRDKLRDVIDRYGRYIRTTTESET
jgi:hypothetical protein